MTDTFRFPPFLKKGDKVAVLSPAGKIDKHFIAGAKQRFEEWGLKVSVGKHAGGSSGRFSGTTRQRLADLQKAMDDPDIQAILCSRGGYGCIHLIDKIDFTVFREHPKWLLGYSDITLLHALLQKEGFASIHSLMARHLTTEPADDPCTRQLHDLMFGQCPHYQFEGHQLNKKGKATGILRGGNLSVLYSLRGTGYDFPPEGAILFIEDIGERPYHIDRMMNNLRLGGILEKLNGLIVGQFTEYEEDPSLGKIVYEMMADLVKDYPYPVCFGFPVGHVSRNYPLVCGSKVEITVSKKSVELKTCTPKQGEPLPALCKNKEQQQQ